MSFTVTIEMDVYLYKINLQGFLLSITTMSNLQIDLHLYANLLSALRKQNIQFIEPNTVLPIEATLHDTTAKVPTLIISPCNESDVITIAQLLTQFELYDQMPVSIRSGGHGYHNGATCNGIMINLFQMTSRNIVGNRLTIEPGVLLGQTINTLANAKKALPHGDCYGVAAGGHFITAGWDIILSRQYGLACQLILSARVVLWDGTVLDVTEDSHPDLLWAIRGGAAAEVGIVTQLQLKLTQEPKQISFRLCLLNYEQLKIMVAHKIFEKAFSLPNDISISCQFYFDPDQHDPVCSLNIFSLRNVTETLICLHAHLGQAIYALIDDIEGWSVGPLMDIRLLPASDELQASPDMLAKVTGVKLKQNPTSYWSNKCVRREMQDSCFATVAGWATCHCEPVLLDVYRTFKAEQDHPLRDRCYAAFFVGGGKIAELSDKTAMPISDMVWRFEVRWDEEDISNYKIWATHFRNQFAAALSPYREPIREYRGDIWLKEQAYDPKLEAICARYNTRVTDSELVEQCIQ